MMASKKDTKNKMATGKESFYGKPTNNFFLISPLNRPTLLQLPYQQHYKCTPPPLSTTCLRPLCIVRKLVTPYYNSNDSQFFIHTQIYTDMNILSLHVYTSHCMDGQVLMVGL